MVKVTEALACVLVDSGLPQEARGGGPSIRETYISSTPDPLLFLLFDARKGGADHAQAMLRASARLPCQRATPIFGLTAARPRFFDSQSSRNQALDERAYRPLHDLPHQHANGQSQAIAISHHTPAACFAAHALLTCSAVRNRPFSCSLACPGQRNSYRTRSTRKKEAIGDERPNFCHFASCAERVRLASTRRLRDTSHACAHSLVTNVCLS